MGDTFKVYYFNSRGWAEPVRMILSYAKADWEDVRIPMTPPVSTIPADIKALAPFGQVPLLEFNGQIISQSQSMTRFLARKYNLVGATDLEAARCDEIADAARDYALLWRTVSMEKDEAKLLEAVTKAVGDSKTRFLSKFSEIVKTNGTGYLVGKSLTWADIYVAYLIFQVEKRSKVPLAQEYPALSALQETVFNTPGIKEWIAKRPETDF